MGLLWVSIHLKGQAQGTQPEVTEGVICVSCPCSGLWLFLRCRGGSESVDISFEYLLV